MTPKDYHKQVEYEKDFKENHKKYFVQIAQTMALETILITRKRQGKRKQPCSHLDTAAAMLHEAIMVPTYVIPTDPEEIYEYAYDFMHWIATGDNRPDWLPKLKSANGGYLFSLDDIKSYGGDK